MFGRILLGSFAVAALVAGVVRLSTSPRPIAEREASSLPQLPSDEEEGPGRPEQLRREALPPPFEAQKALAHPKRPPGPNDWLAHHAERGQSLEEWSASRPIKVSGDRRTIYLQPLGTFTAAQQKVVTITADYLERFFGVRVRTMKGMPASVVPDVARRLNPNDGHPQLLTTWVLEELVRRRPPDALAYIALTPADLYPDESWNFVYGQATLQERVGVWSMWRFGDPAASKPEFDRALRRTIVTAVHELGHMLTIEHCVAWECVMNGVNHDEEAEAAPLEPCPSDLAKLCAATACDPAQRFARLIQFWERHPAVSDQTLHHLRAARAALAMDAVAP